MYNSINHFVEFGVEKIEKDIKNFIQEGKNIADLVYDLQDNLFELGRNIVKEVLEDMNTTIKDLGVRKQYWSVVDTNRKSLVTSFGKVEYSRTYFKSKKSGKRTYLVDDIVGIESHEKITSDVVINAVEEAVESSYRKGGEKATFVDDITKQAVMNKIHDLDIIENEITVNEKKKCKILYIEADEDHVSIQKKGLKSVENEFRGKRNTYISKLVYVHEGIDSEKSINKRNVLKNVRYFSHEDNSEELWLKVAKYISEVYEEEYIDTVYLSGDGARWIKEGLNWISKSKYVLDNHHQNKYSKIAIGHLDKNDELRDKLTSSLKTANKAMLMETFEKILKITESESKVFAIKECRKYFLNNWNGIKIKHENASEIVGCSAEGHISHILSSRLSSRPKGWSKHGTNQMNKLIVYSKNGGRIYDLVMLQKLKNKKIEKELEKDKLIKSLRNKAGKYDEILNVDVPVIGSGRKTSLYKSLKGLSNLVG